MSHSSRNGRPNNTGFDLDGLFEPESIQDADRELLAQQALLEAVGRSRTPSLSAVTRRSRRTSDYSLPYDPTRPDAEGDSAPYDPAAWAALSDPTSSEGRRALASRERGAAPRYSPIRSAHSPGLRSRLPYDPASPLFVSPGLNDPLRRSPSVAAGAQLTPTWQNSPRWKNLMAATSYDWSKDWIGSLSQRVENVGMEHHRDRRNMGRRQARLEARMARIETRLGLEVVDFSANLSADLEDGPDWGKRKRSLSKKVSFSGFSHNSGLTDEQHDFGEWDDLSWAEEGSSDDSDALSTPTKKRRTDSPEPSSPVRVQFSVPRTPPKWVQAKTPKKPRKAAPKAKQEDDREEAPTPTPRRQAASKTPKKQAASAATRTPPAPKKAKATATRAPAVAAATPEATRRSSRIRARDQAAQDSSPTPKLGKGKAKK